MSPFEADMVFLVCGLVVGFSVAWTRALLQRWTLQEKLADMVKIAARHAGDDATRHRLMILVEALDPLEPHIGR